MIKRAQAAMEFLMAYGWAILAVLLTVGALAYFGVIQGGKFLPESCTLFPGVACVDFNINRVEASFLIQNGGGQNFNIFMMSIPNCLSGEALGGLRDGERRNIVLDCDIPWDSIKGDIDITYAQLGVSHQRQGRINTKVLEPNGLLLFDHFEGTHKGISSSGISYGSGRLGQGIIIDASDTLRYADSTTVPFPLNLNAGTIEMWVKPTWSASDANQHYLFDFWRASSSTNRIYFFRRLEEGRSRLIFQIPNGITCSAPCRLVFNIDTWNANEWHHVAATWQRNAGANNDAMYLYIDRNLVNSSTGMELSGLANPMNFMELGNQFNFGTFTFDGTIDEFKIYNYARTY